VRRDSASQPEQLRVFLSDSGNFTYIVTIVRITSGDEPDQRTGSWVFFERAIGRFKGYA
jgi:hypothetical protein